MDLTGVWIGLNVCIVECNESEESIGWGMRVVRINYTNVPMDGSLMSALQLDNDSSYLEYDSVLVREIQLETTPNKQQFIAIVISLYGKLWTLINYLPSCPSLFTFMIDSYCHAGKVEILFTLRNINRRLCFPQVEFIARKILRS